MNNAFALGCKHIHIILGLRNYHFLFLIGPTKQTRLQVRYQTESMQVRDHTKSNCFYGLQNKLHARDHTKSNCFYGLQNKLHVRDQTKSNCFYGLQNKLHVRDQIKSNFFYPF